MSASGAASGFVGVERIRAQDAVDDVVIHALILEDILQAQGKVIVELPHDRRGIFAGDAEKVQDEGEDFVAVDVPAGIHDDVQDADGLTAQGSWEPVGMKPRLNMPVMVSNLSAIPRMRPMSVAGSSSPAKRG